MKEFCAVEASVTVKIKGVTKSQLLDRTKGNEGMYIVLRYFRFTFKLINIKPDYKYRG